MTLSAVVVMFMDKVLSLSLKNNQKRQRALRVNIKQASQPLVEG